MRQYKLEFTYASAHYRQIERHIHKKFDNLDEWVYAENVDLIINEIRNYKDR